MYVLGERECLVDPVSGFLVIRIIDLGRRVHGRRKVFEEVTFGH
jgi:hypothetical protein